MNTSSPPSNTLCHHCNTHFYKKPAEIKRSSTHFCCKDCARISVPENIYGKEHPKEGGNYAGIVGYSYGNKIPRSYVMTKIDVPLKKGMRYCVKFNLSLAEASKYASNNIGAKLSKKPFGSDSKLPLIDEASLLHYDNDHKIMSARYDWTEVCGTFVAEGGEKYITIGNFNSDDETKSGPAQIDTEGDEIHHK